MHLLYLILINDQHKEITINKNIIMLNKKLNVKISIAKDSNSNDILIADAKKNTKYYCYDCDKELIPRKGNVVQHHYSHKSNANCNGESWQHKFCKKIIKKYLTNIIFEVYCNKCHSQNIYKYDNDHKAIEEQQYNEYKIDLGININEKICGAIEIYHTHKVETIKQNEIINNGIDFIEIRTENVLSKINDIMNNEKLALKCENTNICTKCDDYNIIKEIRAYIEKYNELFENVQINANIIEINDCKIKKMLCDDIKFVYGLNDEIQDGHLHENENNLNNEIHIDRTKYYINNNSIIAGSFICNKFQYIMSKFDANVKCNWKYNDIDIWLYDENGLISIDNKGFDPTSYLYDHEYVTKITARNYDNEFDFNYIKTPHAKNISDLLHNFDIPCCQIAYSNNTCYLTIKCFYALITNKNVMECCDPRDKKIMLEYKFIYADAIKTMNQNYNNEMQYTKISKYDVQFDSCNGNIINEYIPKYPILCNVNVDKNIYNTVQKYKTNMVCDYTNREHVKKLGCKFDAETKNWYLPNNISIMEITKWINKINQTNIEITNDINEWNKGKIFLLTTSNPTEFWCIICLLSNYDKIRRRLYAEVEETNILLEDAIKIIYLSGINMEYVTIIESGRYQHDEDGGWGCGFERSQIIKNKIKELLNNKILREIMKNLRFSQRIKKYQNRGFEFEFKFKSK